MAAGLQTSVSFCQQMKRRGKMFDDFQRKYELGGIIGERDFLLVPFGRKLLSGRIKIDGENLHIGIPFHKLDELRTGHQSGAEQTRRSRRLDPAQETQQTAWEGAEIYDRLRSVRQPLQSASKRDMETITTFQRVMHRRGKACVLRSKRLVPRRLIGSYQPIELASREIITHWIHGLKGRACR